MANVRQDQINEAYQNDRAVNKELEIVAEYVWHCTRRESEAEKKDHKFEVQCHNSLDGFCVSGKLALRFPRQTMFTKINIQRTLPSQKSRGRLFHCFLRLPYNCGRFLYDFIIIANCLPTTEMRLLWFFPTSMSQLQNHLPWPGNLRLQITCFSLLVWFWNSEVIQLYHFNNQTEPTIFHFSFPFSKLPLSKNLLTSVRIKTLIAKKYSSQNIQCHLHSHI